MTVKTFIPTDREISDFARVVFSDNDWECDGKHITVNRFPEGASIIPHDIEEKIAEAYAACEPISLGWLKQTGWYVIYWCGNNDPILWWMQNGPQEDWRQKCKDKIKELTCSPPTN